jgi:hypothetical protein
VRVLLVRQGVVDISFRVLPGFHKKSRKSPKEGGVYEGGRISVVREMQELSGRPPAAQRRRPRSGVRS